MDAVDFSKVLQMRGYSSGECKFIQDNVTHAMQHESPCDTFNMVNGENMPQQTAFETF